MSRLLVWTAAFSFLAIAQAAGQQQQQTPPRDAREIVLEKLRVMGQEPVRDTTGADSLKKAAPPVVRGPAAVPRTSAGMPDFHRDSLMQALLRLEGFTATEYKALTARFNADSGNLILTAKPDSQAAVLQGGQSMVADSLLTYDRLTFIACGFGKPVLMGEGADAPVQSERVCYNTKLRVGTAINATTELSEGANWRVRGDLYTRDTDLYVDHAIFTDCTETEPHYHFSAREIKVVNKDVLVARNVTLNFGDVPVFWLPFMMQSLKQGRRTGILMPEFSINDIVRRNSRYNRKITNVGFYWATSEYIGVKLAMGWFSNNWTQLEGVLDYRFADRFLDGAVRWGQYWQAGGSKVNTIAGNTNWAPNERTSLRADLAYSSSSSFIKQNSFDTRELNRSIDSNGSLTRRFDWSTITLGVSRRQFLSTNTVDMTLPSASLSLPAVTLFPAAGEARWYNNATWTGGAQARFTSKSVDELLTPTGFDGNDMTGSANSSFTLGRLSWSQAFAMKRGTRHERAEGLTEDGDTIRSAPGLTEQRMNWNTGLSFQQRLIGTSTFTPGISLRGEAARDTATGLVITAPMRMEASTSIKIDLFGFWPGFGPLAQVRHHLSPTIGYSYSPALQPDSTQTRVFGATEVREQNRITIGMSQTIEGKFIEKKTELDSTAAVDTTSTDPDRPRRLPQSRKIRLISLNTDAVVYDFEEAKRTFGVQTTQITNSVNSDLLPGLQFSVTHDLFRPIPLPEGAPAGTRPQRDFAPHLSYVSASFSLTGESWLFKKLGLTGTRAAAPAARPTPAQTPEPAPQQATGGLLPGGSSLGLLGAGRPTDQPETPQARTGSWNASFNYILNRPRATGVAGDVNQMLRADVRFQPTQNWSVSWNTHYSFTTKEFADHVLTLTRELHDWDANFDFVKAQNGNFSFQFRVALRANPDIKFDYDQRDNTRRELAR